MGSITIEVDYINESHYEKAQLIRKNNPINYSSMLLCESNKLEQKCTEEINKIAKDRGIITYLTSIDIFQNNDQGEFEHGIEVMGTDKWANINIYTHSKSTKLVVKISW
jgi:hypothetical protein